jgi:hypothetical protein
MAQRRYCSETLPCHSLHRFPPCICFLSISQSTDEGRKMGLDGSASTYKPRHHSINVGLLCTKAICTRNGYATKNSVQMISIAISPRSQLCTLLGVYPLASSFGHIGYVECQWRLGRLDSCSRLADPVSASSLTDRYSLKGIAPLGGT